MDELVFTNQGWPKVMLYQERSWPGRLAAFTAKWPPNLVATNVIARRRMTAGIDVSSPEDVSEVITSGTWRAGTDTQEFI
jgi:hypothetical protein